MKSTSGKVFVDSNIWCYSLDSRSPDKRRDALALISTLSIQDQVVISTQVLNEVYVVATRKMGIDPLKAKSVTRNMLDFEVVTVEPDTIELAIDFSILEQISYWDALMLAAAYRANCQTLLTEDLNSGQVIQGIKILNPFFK